MKKFEFPIGHYYVTTDPKKPNPILYANIQRAIFARGGKWFGGQKEVLYLDCEDTSIRFDSKLDAKFRRDNSLSSDGVKPAIDLIQILFQVGDKLKYNGEIYTVTGTPTHGSTGIFISHPRGMLNLSVAENVDLIPSDQKSVEKTYLEIHEESGLKVGDKVRVVKEVPSKDKGWDTSWNAKMSNSIGSIGLIKKDCNQRGFKVWFTDDFWMYPAHALEKVNSSTAITECQKPLGLKATVAGINTTSFHIDAPKFGLPVYAQYVGRPDDCSFYFKIPTSHSGDVAPKHLKLKKVKVKQVPFKGLDVAKKKSNLLQDKISKKLKQKEKENEKNRTARNW